MPHDEPPPVPVPLAVVEGPLNPVGPDPDPATLGTLQPDAPVTRVYTLRAQAEGISDVLAVVTAADPFSSGSVSASGIRSK